MSENIRVEPEVVFKDNEVVANTEGKAEETNKTSVCALWVIMFFFPIAGIIYAYIKRGGAKNNYEKSHASYAIRTFWWGMLWLAIGLITLFIFVGILILIISSIWYVYRTIKGFIRATEGVVIR